MSKTKRKTAQAAAAAPHLNPTLAKANGEHQVEAGLAATTPSPKHDHERVHAARTPPGIRLLDKAEVMAIANVTYPTIWTWMRDGKFPRSRVVGGKSMWLSSEIEQWLAALPVRALKGDQPTEVL